MPCHSVERCPAYSTKSSLALLILTSFSDGSSAGVAQSSPSAQSDRPWEHWRKRSAASRAEVQRLGSANADSAKHCSLEGASEWQQALPFASCSPTMKSCGMQKPSTGAAWMRSRHSDQDACPCPSRRHRLSDRICSPAVM